MGRRTLGALMCALVSLTVVSAAGAQTSFIGSNAGHFYESFASTSGSTVNLTGEELRSNFQPCPAFAQSCITTPPQPVVQATCNPSGTSTIQFTRSGTASGPFLGTFTETLTATVGPQNQPARNEPGSPPTGPPPVDSAGLYTGPVTQFQAQFTIDNALNQPVVTGSKQLTADPASFGVCREFNSEQTESPMMGGFQTGYFYALYVRSAGYQATINDPILGTAQDQGTSEVRLMNAFTTYTTDAPVAASKDDCKEGSWQTHTRANGSHFKNQGDCIQYVNTGV